MTAPNIAIRDACADDLDALSALAFASKASWGYDATFMAQCRAELTFDAGRLARERIRVAEENGRIVGMSSCWVDRDADALEVEDFFVAPGAFGRGIGRRLMDDMIGFADAEGVQLMLVDADPNAQSIYEALGFRQYTTSPSASIPGRMLPRLRRELAPPA